MAVSRVLRFGQSIAVFFLVVCFFIGQIRGQTLTPTHREEIEEARREQQILMNIREEVTNMVEQAREETVLPALELYSVQMNELYKTIANVSDIFTNLTAKIEDLQNELNNGSVEFGCADDSWISYDRRCYHFSKNQVSWSSAKASCRAMDAILAEARTERINTFLKREAMSRGSTSWIGGHDWITEGRWEWDSTGEAIGYMDWGPDQPNDVRVGQDCLELLAKFQYEWNDRECGNVNYYICQSEPQFRRVNN